MYSLDQACKGHTACKSTSMHELSIHMISTPLVCTLWTRLVKVTRPESQHLCWSAWVEEKKKKMRRREWEEEEDEKIHMIWRPLVWGTFACARGAGVAPCTLCIRLKNVTHPKCPPVFEHASVQHSRHMLTPEHVNFSSQTLHIVYHTKCKLLHLSQT